MANSPLVAYPTSALHPNLPTTRPTSTAPSPLKPIPSGIASPSPAIVVQADPSGAVTLANDPFIPAEQLNDWEKHKYVKGKKLGEGTYANVYLGHLRSDPSQLVAIKKIKVQKEFRDGIAPDAIRELKHLQELNHPNIIKLLSVFTSKDQNLNIVLEYLPLGDLEGLIRDTSGIPYGPADVKAWMGMIARGVWFCHDNFVLHRDIKPNNCLIATDGTVKLADFGLARAFGDPFTTNRPMTANVITIWYRPPELLFGAPFYSAAVDIWSVGVMFAELINRAALLPGQTEMEEISLICKVIGTPTEDNWPGVTSLPHYAVPDDKTPVTPREVYMQRFGSVGAEGVDLLMRMLALDPRKRVTAREMLEHKWWRAEPRPTRLEDLPRNRKEGNAEKYGQDQGRKPGVLDDKNGNRGDKVARRLDFGAAKK